MRIELHVFGSRTGYGTLGHTPGLSPGDCRLLEGGAYRFGQPDAGGYRPPPGRPACFTRLLPGGRRGLTCVWPGDADDNGRPTLRMITAVLSQRDWDHLLGGDIALLLDDAALWQSARTAAGLSAAAERQYVGPATRLPADAVGRAVELLSRLDRSPGRPVVVPAPLIDFDTIRAVEMLLPTSVRPRYATAWMSLSRKLDADVNAVADPASTGTAGAAAAGVAAWPETAVAPSRYAQALADEGVLTGDLATPLPRTYRGFGEVDTTPVAAAADGFVPPPMPRAIQPRRSKTVVRVGVAVLLLLVAAAVWALVTRRGGVHPVASTTPSAITLSATTPSATTSSPAVTRPASEPSGAIGPNLATAAKPTPATAVAATTNATTQPASPTTDASSAEDADQVRREMLAQYNEGHSRLAATQTTAPATTTAATRPATRRTKPNQPSATRSAERPKPVDHHAKKGGTK